MAKRDLELKIGVFITTGMVLLIAMILAFGGFRLFRDTYPVTCYFKESVNGIAPGVAVGMLGKTIGKATSLDIIEPSKVRVVLEIEKPYKIPKGSVVRKVQQSFLGDYFLEVCPPTEKADEFLPTDGKAEIEGGVEASIGDLAPKVSKMLTDYEPRLAELMANLNGTVASLNTIVSDKESQKYLKDTLKYASETAVKAPAIADQVNTLVAAATVLVKNINTATDTFNAQIAALGKDYQLVAKDINSVAGKLDTVLTSIQRISEKANGESTVGKLVSDPELYKKMVEAVEEAKSTLAQIKKTVKLLEEDPSVVFWGSKKKAAPPPSTAWWQHLFAKEGEEGKDAGREPERPAPGKEPKPAHDKTPPPKVPE